jgi:DNA (cytosine-5)-methyltransferase 1
MPVFYEFFAGGGMARQGLGDGWDCLFANDFDAKKAAGYRANWGGDHLKVADVAALSVADLPGAADLAWASFPCQDLSLAGARRGVGDAGGGESDDGAGGETDNRRTRSGAFWPFWRLMRDLAAEGRAPKLIALENVVGALTSNHGADFRAIIGAFQTAGYRCGALVIDAARFTPQSRPRLFVIGLRGDLPLPADLIVAEPVPAWTPLTLARAHAGPDAAAQDNRLWWNLPEPPPPTETFADLLEDAPEDAPLHTPAQTAALLAMMNPRHRAKVAAAQALGRLTAGGVYKRIRVENGRRVQRAEVRFDGLAGCLRTPSGGSSRQTVLIVDGPVVRSRLLSAREAARLMGLPDTYKLPARYTDAYHLAGDGVAPPVVAWLARCLFEPLLRAGATTTAPSLAAE